MNLSGSDEIPTGDKKFVKTAWQIAENHYNWPYWLIKKEFEMKVYLVIGGYNYEGGLVEESRIAATREKAEVIRAELQAAEDRYDYVDIYEKTIED